MEPLWHNSLKATVYLSGLMFIAIEASQIILNQSIFNIMKKITVNRISTMLRTGIITFSLVVAGIMLLSFTINKLTDDFLKQLGITKPAADSKITNSILGGHLNTYGAANATRIVVGSRTAVAKDLLVYTKQYVNTDAFKKEYIQLKESNKPTEYKIQTPEQMRAETIDMYKKSIAETEATLKKADASMKPIFENVLAENRKQLKDIEDPKNKMIANYTKNYEGLLKTNQQSYSQSLQEWENKYPSNHLLFVKQRLLRFLEETKDIDFSAALTVKNNKKIFVNPDYERKGSYWKMGFRAGKEVVEPARTFVQQWLNEIK